jgi:hypothetical protein
VELAKTTVKDFYAAGFDALVKRWDQCIKLVENMSGNKCFFPGSNITCVRFYIHLLLPIY